MLIFPCPPSSHLGATAPRAFSGAFLMPYGLFFFSFSLPYDPLETTARHNASHNHSHKCDHINNHEPQSDNCHHHSGGQPLMSTVFPATNVMPQLVIIWSPVGISLTTYHKLMMPCHLHHHSIISPHDHNQYSTPTYQHNNNMTKPSLPPLPMSIAQPVLMVTINLVWPTPMMLTTLNMMTIMVTTLPLVVQHPCKQPSLPWHNDNNYNSNSQPVAAPTLVTTTAAWQWQWWQPCHDNYSGHFAVPTPNMQQCIHHQLPPWHNNNNNLNTSTTMATPPHPLPMCYSCSQCTTAPLLTITIIAWWLEVPHHSASTNNFEMMTMIGHSTIPLPMCSSALTDGHHITMRRMAPSLPSPPMWAALHW